MRNRGLLGGLVIIYAGIVSILVTINLGMALSEGGDSGFASTVSYIILLPIFGRVFGWW